MQWTFGAVGDVFVDRPDPEHAFRHAADLLNALDLVFGNCEGAYTDRPQFAPSANWRVVAPRRNGRGLAAAGFDVMACANNHMLDAGHAGLADTLELLHGQGIRTAGAGASEAEAHAPLTVELRGLKVGVLALASVYLPGYEARKNVPGIAALRVHSHYYIPDWDAYGRCEPGVVPQVRTIPFPEDMDRLAGTLRAMRAAHDVVIASFHWGNAGAPATISEYEFTVGRAAVDLGADIVLGHHHHALRGIEIYRGKPIFYGLGHFVFDLPGLEAALTPFEIEKLEAMGEHAIYPRAGFPLSPFPAECRCSMVATVRFDGPRLVEAGYVPCLIDGANHAVPAAHDSDAGRQVAAYVEGVSAKAGLRSRYAPGTPVDGFGTIGVHADGS